MITGVPGTFKKWMSLIAIAGQPQLVHFLSIEVKQRGQGPHAEGTKPGLFWLLKEYSLGSGPKEPPR